jgi:hypothetical protein
MISSETRSKRFTGFFLGIGVLRLVEFCWLVLSFDCLLKACLAFETEHLPQ